MIAFLIEICGWIGSLSYAIYSIPQAVDALKLGYTKGLSSCMVILLFGGGACSLLYILPDTELWIKTQIRRCPGSLPSLPMC